MGHWAVLLQNGVLWVYGWSTLEAQARVLVLEVEPILATHDSWQQEGVLVSHERANV